MGGLLKRISLTHWILIAMVLGVLIGVASVVILVAVGNGSSIAVGGRSPVRCGSHLLRRRCHLQ